MNMNDICRRWTPHPPVNPLTGQQASWDQAVASRPGRPDAPSPADAPASQTTPLEEDGAGACAEQGASSGAAGPEASSVDVERASASAQAEGLAGASTEAKELAGASAKAAEPAGAAAQTKVGSAPLGETSDQDQLVADASVEPLADGEAPMPPSPQAAVASDNELLLERLRAVADSRIVATALLCALLFAVMGFDNPLLFLIVLFVGYVLLDRFVNVRRCVVLGSITWLAVLLLGNLVTDSVSAPIFLTIDYLFMVSGFLFALAVCLAFFCGRAMYEHGVARGQAEADRAIARHIVGRLIEHPDDWSGLDGDYLECESAINRVRERQRAVEQSARDEARRKDDLVTYLAHDLKTPLASVVGYLSLLEEAPELPAEHRVHFTGIALEKAHRLDALIEEFFDITRFDFHDIVLTRGYVDLNLMLGQVVDEFYPTLAEQGKSVDLDVPPGLTALIDGDKMARVFNNVMRNAIAYSYEGSTIHIEAERVEGKAEHVADKAEHVADKAEHVADKAEHVAGDGGSIVVRFENEGDPIPEPKLKMIFEKFYRLDAARATNRGGAGLGLAIAKEIVAAHGGTISCESTPEHTVFTITLPA